LNFIGHAYAALARDDAPAFVLGAMLPDFLGMARIRGARSSHPDVARGVALHHACDDAFHRGTTFIRLCGELGDDLERRGVRRGPARAVAHVGLELLMDGFLVDRPGVADAYLAAIMEAEPSRLGARMDFRRDEHRERYAALSRRLTEWGVPEGYADPVIVRDRLVRILAHRPRLSLGEAEAQTVGLLLPRAKERVGESLEALVGAALRTAREMPIG
jgi:hypothetical protein